jgi:hypothetical protein
LSRFDRTERLAAANAVIVVAAYFEALAEAGCPLDRAELELRRVDHVRLAGGEPASALPGALAVELLRADVPLPGPQSPHEVAVRNLRGFYQNLSAAVLAFVSGLDESPTRPPRPPPSLPCLPSGPCVSSADHPRGPFCGPAPGHPQKRRPPAPGDETRDEARKPVAHLDGEDSSARQLAAGTLSLRSST